MTDSKLNSSAAAMSRDEVREIDRKAVEDFGVPSVILMENAGRGCVDWLEEIGVSGRVVVCAGKGNNAGDGFVIARHLANRGHAVQLLLFCDPADLKGDAETNYRIVQQAGLPVRVFAEVPSAGDLDNEFTGAEWLVDALLGTGTRGSLRDPFPVIIEAFNRAEAKKLAVDLPSGLDCDAGTPVDEENPLAVIADFTATLAARKIGFDNADSRRFTGEVRVIDIGIPRSVYTSGGEE